MIIVLQDGVLEEEITTYFEHNHYVDRILLDVMQYAGARRIVFSSFDPDVCAMLRLKQNKYPVLLLFYEDFYGDPRANNPSTAIQFCGFQKFLGFNPQANMILKNPNYVKEAKDLGLVVIPYVDHDIEDENDIKEIKQLGIDGVIYDRISELKEHKVNVFKMENQAKMDLVKDIRSVCQSSGHLISNGEKPGRSNDK